LNPTIKTIIRFWSQEHILTALLLVLIIRGFLLAPTLGSGLMVRFISDLVLYVILFAGLQSMVRQKLLKSILSVFVVLSIITNIACDLFDLSSLTAWDFVFSTFAVTGMFIVTLWMVYQDGPVTAHRIRGSIAAYLLLSVLFAKTYALINYIDPLAFNISTALTQFRVGNQEAFYYFSVVTLTTAGFGDITPIAPSARSFVMAEALIGQLYPAILIARLVSLSVAAKEKK
jgi:hypothetical protein